MKHDRQAEKRKHSPLEVAIRSCAPETLAEPGLADLRLYQKSLAGNLPQEQLSSTLSIGHIELLRCALGRSGPCPLPSLST